MTKPVTRREQLERLVAVLGGAVARTRRLEAAGRLRDPLSRVEQHFLERELHLLEAQLGRRIAPSFPTQLIEARVISGPSAAP